MRDDMDKVIVERPRHEDRWGGPKGRRANRSHEDLPAFEGIGKLKGNTKSLNENLAPLRRFIQKQVNRPWNKVFSEISALIKPGNTVQEHILGHIDDFIERKAVKVPATEKYPCGLRGNSRFGGMTVVYAGDLYVDPDDNIIKVARQRVFVPSKRKPKREPVWIDSNRIATQENGTWFSVEVARFTLGTYRVSEPMTGLFGTDNPKKRVHHYERTKNRFVHPDGTFADKISDAILGLVGANETLKLEYQYGTKNVYGVHGTKRSLSARDLKKLNLKNEEPKDESRT